MSEKTRWYAGKVTRPNAGNLFNAVRWEGSCLIEADITPTHSEALAQKMADELNRKDGWRLAGITTRRR